MSTNQHQALHRFLKRFAADAAAAATQIAAHYGVTNVVEGRKSKVIPRTGDAAGWAFSFHGKGLRASRPGTWLDFDFLPDGAVGGFDPWRMHWYLEENGIGDVLTDVAALGAAFREMEADGLIKKVEGTELFVLS